MLNINELLNIHEHAWYMDIKAKSDVKYLLSCSLCDARLCLGYWSLVTGHRYCVETPQHYEPQELVQPIIIAKNIMFSNMQV